MGFFTSVIRLFVCVAVASWAVQQADGCTCTPAQYVVALGQVNGLVVAGKGISQINNIAMAADFTNNRVSENITSTSMGRTTNLRVIIDYKKNVMYTINGQTCLKGTAIGYFKQCVPKTAHSDGSFVVGDGKLTVDAYSYYSNVPGVLMGNTTLGLTHGDCIPFSTTIIGQTLNTPTPLPIMSLTGYADFKRGISDPGKWFDIPSFCPKSTANRFDRAAVDDQPFNPDMQLIEMANALMMPPAQE